MWPGGPPASAHHPASVRGAAGERPVPLPLPIQSASNPSADCTQRATCLQEGIESLDGRIIQGQHQRLVGVPAARAMRCRKARAGSSAGGCARPAGNRGGGSGQHEETEAKPVACRRQRLHDSVGPHRAQPLLARRCRVSPRSQHRQNRRTMARLRRATKGCLADDAASASASGLCRHRRRRDARCALGVALLQFCFACASRPRTGARAGDFPLERRPTSACHNTSGSLHGRATRTTAPAPQTPATAASTDCTT